MENTGVGGDVTQLSGADATEAVLEERGLARYAVLHFASHAVANELTPLLSALILAPGNGSDGHWTAEKIYRTSVAADPSRCGRPPGRPFAVGFWA